MLLGTETPRHSRWTVACGLWTLNCGAVCVYAVGEVVRWY